MTEERKYSWWWSPFRSAQVSMLTTYIIPTLLFLCQGYTPLGHLLVLLVFIISLLAIFGLMWVIVSKYCALCSFYFFFFFSHSEDICVLQPAGDWILICWILWKPFIHLLLNVIMLKLLLKYGAFASENKIY